MRLALRYRKPVIAYLKAQDEIPGLPAEVPWQPNLHKVEAFIIRQLCGFGG